MKLFLGFGVALAASLPPFVTIESPKSLLETLFKGEKIPINDGYETKALCYSIAFAWREVFEHVLELFGAETIRAHMPPEFLLENAIKEMPKLIIPETDDETLKTLIVEYNSVLDRAKNFEPSPSDSESTPEPGYHGERRHVAPNFVAPGRYGRMT